MLEFASLPIFLSSPHPGWWDLRKEAFQWFAQGHFSNNRVKTKAPAWPPEQECVSPWGLWDLTYKSFQKINIVITATDEWSSRGFQRAFAVKVSSGRLWTAWGHECFRLYHKSKVQGYRADIPNTTSFRVKGNELKFWFLDLFIVLGKGSPWACFLVPRTLCEHYMTEYVWVLGRIPGPQKMINKSLLLFFP